MTNDDQDSARSDRPDHRLATMENAELVTLGQALDLRVRGGAATLQDFGALARVRRELERRAEAGRRAQSRGTADPA